uniref:Putative product n=1 Tax=Xenopsylla cheopis TaxID=163159 RepID=A0A6M2E151_XENCH
MKKILCLTINLDSVQTTLPFNSVTVAAINKAFNSIVLLHFSILAKHLIRSGMMVLSLRSETCCLTMLNFFSLIFLLENSRSKLAMQYLRQISWK